MDFTYGFNYGAADNGNVQSIANNITSARSQTYTYDELNRVSTAKTTATSGTYAWGLAFTYDPWANLLSASVTQGSAYSFSVYSDGFNRIHNTGSTFTYDAAGNLTADPVNSSYTYNAEGELTSAAGVTYTYDGDGDRVQKSNGKLYWYGVGSDPLSESDASGNLTNEYIFLNGARIAMLQLSTSAVNYYVADHLGSSRIVTNSSGSVLDDSDYYPYGGERSYSSGSGNNYKFTGKERDAESGLDDFAARFYTSNYGRFLSADEAKYSHPADPQTWNLYTYVANNPLNAVDPTGHDPSHCASCNFPKDAFGGGGNVGLTETTQGEKDNGDIVEATIQDDQEHAQAEEEAAQAAAEAQQQQQAIQNSQLVVTSRQLLPTAPINGNGDQEGMQGFGLAHMDANGKLTPLSDNETYTLKMTETLDEEKSKGKKPEICKDQCKTDVTGNSVLKDTMTISKGVVVVLDKRFTVNGNPVKVIDPQTGKATDYVHQESTSKTGTVLTYRLDPK